MIEWQEHSTAHERNALADELDNAVALLVEAQRDELKVQAKLARQRKPENIVKVQGELDRVQQRVAQAQAARDKATRVMCKVHVDISLDDIVELVDAAGNRKREPILVETVEFNRNKDGSFWMRIQGILFEESPDGRPQLRQGFDLREHDPTLRVVKHN
jgi:hypothetical protein